MMHKAAEWESGVSPRMVAALAACAACQCGWAQNAEVAAADMQLLAARPELPARIEVAKTVLPRLDGLDSATSGPRLDMTLLPPRRSAFGLALGMGGFQPPQAALGSSSVNTNFDVGVHWRHMTDGNRQIDVTAWRRMMPQPDAYTLIQLHQEPTYMARVEMNLSGRGGAGSRSGFVADHGFIGLQLEGGARVTLRRKNGGAMLYYRSKFW